MNIGLIGSGWLAHPLALALQDQNHQVYVTTRHREKQKQLQEQGLTTEIYQIGEPLPASLRAADVLIIATPSKDIVAHQRLLTELLQLPKLRPIFISSTSVYDEDGKTHTEDSPGILSEKPLYKIEQLMRQHPNTTIIRCGGLIGPKRHPGRYYSGKTIKNPQAPVNLLPQVDAIGIIGMVVNKGLVNTVINACSDDHPLKGDYYPKMTQQLELPAATIGTKSDNFGKTVNTDRLTLQLNYQFQGSIWKI